MQDRLRHTRCVLSLLLAAASLSVAATGRADEQPLPSPDRRGEAELEPPPRYPPAHAEPPPWVPPPYALYPKTMRYEEGMRIPPGYHRESRIRRGLVIAGAITFGTLHLFSIGIASLDTDSTKPLYAPVVGPIIAIGTLEPSTGGAVILAVDALGQAAGLAMLIAGLAATKEILVRDDVVELTLTPVVGENQRGLSLTGRF